MKTYQKYIPALSYRWLTPFYDFLFAATMPEKKLRMEILRQARVEPRNNVLDIGCGTGTQLILIKKLCSNTKLFGVDGDMQILRMAEAKARKASVDLTLQCALSFHLPYFANSFHLVLSTLMFHHLNRANKLSTAHEIFRVLRPGGHMHVADFGTPQNYVMKLAAFLSGLFEDTRENIQGNLPQVFTQAGFKDVQNVSNFQTVFGTLSLYNGIKEG